MVNLHFLIISWFVCLQCLQVLKVSVSETLPSSVDQLLYSCVIHAPQSQVCWSSQTVLLENFNILYAQGELESACDNNKCNVTFDNKTDRYTLKINSVQHYDAGFYECGECYSRDVEQAAQLIVLQPTAGSEGM